ncbi:MAG: peptide-methionine (S)-S-oxide reductase MsrA [Patescibacteria group bacterium]|nr:peptide-methionine (S)-S-oxide reductase MsrA [Patescibacteria group bacterium]
MIKQEAYFGGGCFWCTEAIFKNLEGVILIEPGYCGGSVANPTYEQVSRGDTGHAETIRIVFDSDVLSFDRLLDVFFHTHDPTSLNRQGNDSGTQYRSVIFYVDDEQKSAAKGYIRKLGENGEFSKPIVTDVTAFDVFYPAEDYHRDYFANHSKEPYCQLVINPKIEHFWQRYEDWAKKS